MRDMKPDEIEQPVHVPSEGEPFELLDEVALCARASGMDMGRVRELADFARERDQSLVEVMVERGGASEAALLCGLSELLGLRYIEDESLEISDEVIDAVSPGLATRYRLIPVELAGTTLRVAGSDPFNWRVWDDLMHFVGRPIEKSLATRQTISRLMKANYGVGADVVERLIAERSAQDLEVVSPISRQEAEDDAANEPTVVNLVSQLLSEAIQAGATDIHLEPYESRYRIRCRIDGMLEDISVPAAVSQLRLAVISRIKIMSNLDITEKRLPQDGRCHISFNGQDYDLRVSILPGVYGESVVIRLQTRQMVRLELETLGFRAEEQEKMAQLVSLPHGLLLVTGPTGSGKTTSLYTFLNRINTPTTKIITVEDPVEYWMEDIIQMQVHEDIGFTFARALRGMLRHDPDVLLVGEIRDRETADIAIRASLTGHLVFATLHTNDAASAVTRMLDIGIEPFLVSSSTIGILAQRLVRKICGNCRCETPANAMTQLEQDLVAQHPSVTLYRGAGCEQCRFTGYRGRTAVCEVLEMSPAIREMVQQRQSADKIRDQAMSEGMTALRESGMLAVLSGLTTMEEVMRVTH